MTTNNWWEWEPDERPVLDEDRYCQRCGAVMVFVSHRSGRHSAATGRRLVVWTLLCPKKRWLNWGHESHDVLPQRTALGIQFRDDTVQARVASGSPT